MRAVTMTVYLMIDENDNPRKWNVAEWLDDTGVVGWEVEEGHGDGCPGCESNHMEELGTTYEIAYVNTGDGGGWWGVNDATGEGHGGRFATHEEAEEYAEGRIEMFERIQAAVTA